MGLFGYDFGIYDYDSAVMAAVLTFLVLLVVAIVVATYFVGIKLNKETKDGIYIPESGVAIVIGVVAGGIIQILPLDGQALLTFSPPFFFIGLLPPIIWNEAYHLHQRYFFSLVLEITIFAIFGTAISTAIMALITHAVTAGTKNELTYAEATSFGALISATDPVSVLSVLGQLRVDPNLFYLLFGESVLNDAVSLTVFNIAGKFVASDHGADGVLLGLLDFVIVSLGSLLIGIAFGLSAAVMTNRVDLRTHPVLEMSVYVLMSYIPYLFASMAGMSGIVAILVAGIVTKQYAHRNLSTYKIQQASDMLFRVMAFLADNAVFLYLGLTVFGIQPKSGSADVALIFASLFGCLVGRAVAVFSLSLLINFCAAFCPCTRLKHIKASHQVMLWFAGLRGALAFAAASNFPDALEHRDLIKISTMVIIMATTFLLSPFTTFLIRVLNISVNVEYHSADKSGGGPDTSALVKWIKYINEAYMEPFLVVKCARTGGPCLHGHHQKRCPQSLARRNTRQRLANLASSGATAHRRLSTDPVVAGGADLDNFLRSINAERTEETNIRAEPIRGRAGSTGNLNMSLPDNSIVIDTRVEVMDRVDSFSNEEALAASADRGRRGSLDNMYDFGGSRHGMSSPRRRGGATGRARPQPQAQAGGRLAASDEDDADGSLGEFKQTVMHVEGIEPQHDSDIV
ncbi:unnamed protein product [Chrysoparadoxa australica]